jgi:class 3 adenylate cyclase/predicted ATPase
VHWESSERERTESGLTKPAEAERRQVTVLFCDLVGSTELSGYLDPEDFHEVVQAFQEACAAVVGRYDGQVAKQMGDASVVFFGYPQAHEDDAHRAVRAGLGMVEAVKELNTRLQREKDVRLAVRVGVHTGLVVASQMGSVDAIGETPNVAARLQALAEPDTVLISEATQGLIAGYFDCRELGPRRLKGVAREMPVHLVLHESGARSRLDVAAAVGLTPLVGRWTERAALFEAWDEVAAGRMRVVFVSGEAGIGKSRLVRELAEHVAEDASAWLTPCQCSSYRRNTAFYPIVDVLERVVLTFQPDEDTEARLRKLEGWATQYGHPVDETVPLLAPLFAIPLGDRYGPLPMTPELQRNMVMETLVGTLRSRAAQQPLLFVMEDLHWADPSTLDLLSLLMDRAADVPMLVLLTFRPDFRPPWSGLEAREIALGRLDPDRVAELAQEVAGGRELPPEVRDQIVTKADGVALFAEELTKNVLESGVLREGPRGFRLVGEAPSVSIPATLEGTLLARLDRLTTAREIAQVAAVLGREFPHDLIVRVGIGLGMFDEQAVQRGLAQLVEAEILFESVSSEGVTYVFKHALIRDAAYELLLRSRRREYHARVADVLAKGPAETWDTEPEVLAHHYTEAGMCEEAIVFWQRAAQRAIKASGNLEAIAYVERGLELLEGVRDERARAKYELDLQVTLGMPLIATRGYAAGEVERSYGRARALSLRVGDTPQLPNILWGLWVYYLTGGPLRSALEMADQHAELAVAHPDDSSIEIETYQLKGIPLFYIGHPDRALPHLSRGSERYDRELHHANVFSHGGADTGVALMTHEALALWVLGRADEATERMEAAMTCARGLSHPFSLAFAHYYRAWLHKLRRDEQSALEDSTAAIAICEEFGFPFWGLSSAAIRGTTLVHLGRVDDGIAEARESIAAYEATGALLCRSALLGLLADAYLAAGLPEEGVAAVDDALAGLSMREERWWEPELHRLRGELLWLAAREDDALASLRLAVDVARGQGARAWELRAAESLAMLGAAEAEHPSAASS